MVHQRAKLVDYARGGRYEGGGAKCPKTKIWGGVLDKLYMIKNSPPNRNPAMGLCGRPIGSVFFS